MFKLTVFAGSKRVGRKTVDVLPRRGDTLHVSDELEGVVDRVLGRRDADTRFGMPVDVYLTVKQEK